MKYFRIFIVFVKINFASLFAYRANFYNSLLITLGWGIVSITQIYILTAKVSSVYGWTRNELLLLAGVYSIIIGIFHMFFSSNFEKFSLLSNMGDLDRFFMKPIDNQFLLSIILLKPLYVIRSAIGAAFCIYMLQIMHVTTSFIDIIIFAFFVFFSVMLVYGFWSLCVTLTIWFTNLTNIVDVLYNTTNVGRYPPAILLKTGNYLAFLLVPLTLVSSVPAHGLLHKLSLPEVVGLPLLAGFLLFCSRKFFQFALKSYTSASS